MLTKFLDPKNDIAFRKIFGTEKNKYILIHFINDILSLQIKDVTFLSTVQDPDIAYKKESIVDVLCTDTHGAQIIVEMQVSPQRGFEKRAQYYASKAYSRQLNRGDDYGNLKEVIFIAICDYTLFPQKVAYKSDHIILDKDTYSHDLKDFSFTFIELSKFDKDISALENIIEKWCYFFKYANETPEADLDKIIGSDLVIKKAYEELNRFNWTEIELNTYEREIKRILDNRAIEGYKEDLYKRRVAMALETGMEKGRTEGIAEGMEKGRTEGIAEGMEKGIAEGLEKGAQKTLHQIVTKMLQKGTPLDAIVELTGLTIEEIENMQSSRFKS